jgi:polyisoprenoid-binding protein YceI
MNFRKFSAVTAVAVSMMCVGASAQTSTWNIDSAHSSAQFAIRHMGVSTVHGSITGIKGVVKLDEKDVTKSSVEVTLDTTTVDTANSMRDKDLKSDAFFNVEKNPTMTFKSTAITRINGKLKMTGDLTLNGVTKPVTLDVEGPATPQTARGKTISGISASGVLKRSEFSFGTKDLPPMLGDEVKLVIDIEIDRQ